MHSSICVEKEYKEEIEYNELKMADYLMPNNVNITIDDQRNISAIRNRMIMISSHFSTHKSEEICHCGVE